MSMAAGLRKCGMTTFCVLLVIWGAGDANFMDAENLFGARVCLLLALGIAYLVLAWSNNRSWKYSGTINYTWD